jgi:hypothetical protein
MLVVEDMEKKADEPIFTARTHSEKHLSTILRP